MKEELFSPTPVADDYAYRLNKDRKTATICRFAVCYVTEEGLRRDKELKVREAKLQSQTAAL
jgi:hypothetical protein